MRVIVALTMSVVATVGAERADRETLAGVLARAGQRVEQFFARAQSLVCLEVVHLQPLTGGWTGDGVGRTVESELRLSWDAADGLSSGEAQTLRQVIRVNGHPPRANDWNNCTAPEQQKQEPQPLSLLLASARDRYTFKLTELGRVDGRQAYVVDYREIKAVSVESRLLEGRDDCISFDVDGGMRGRLWIDAETYDVLRLDQGLTGLVEIPVPRKAMRLSGASSWTMERWDTSIRFKRVTFSNPDESLVLPVSMTSLRVTRGSGTPRLRTTTDYVKYQRFITGGRIVGD